MLFEPSKILHFTFYTLHLDETAPRALPAGRATRRGRTPLFRHAFRMTPSPEGEGKNRHPRVSTLPRHPEAQNLFPPVILSEGAQRPSRRILYRKESRKEHGKRNVECRISEGKNIFIASLILHFTLYILHFQGLVRLRGSCPARRSAQGDRWRRLRRPCGGPSKSVDKCGGACYTVFRYI